MLCASRTTTSVRRHTARDPRHQSATGTLPASSSLGTLRRRIDRRTPAPIRTRASAVRSARFLDAARKGDMDGPAAMLAPDAVMVGDGGGKACIARPRCTAPPASPAPRRLLRLVRGVGSQLEPAVVNGQPGFRARAPTAASSTSPRSTSRTARHLPMHSMLNPDKLGPPRADVGPRAAPGAGNPTGMTPATPSAARLRNSDIAPMFNTPFTNSRRVMITPTASPWFARPPAPPPLRRGELNPPPPQPRSDHGARLPRSPSAAGVGRLAARPRWAARTPDTRQPPPGATAERETSLRDDDAFLPEPLPTPSRLPRPGAPRTAARRRELAHLSPSRPVARLATPSPARRAPVCPQSVRGRPRRVGRGDRHRGLAA